MKLQQFAILLFMAGSLALPRTNEVVEPSDKISPVEYSFRRFIERITMGIENSGLDPLEVKRRDIKFNLESLDLVLEAFVEDFSFTGASDIKINTLIYNRFFNILSFDISLPEISLSIGDSGLETFILGKKFKGQLEGSLNIKNIHFGGMVYVKTDVFCGITFHTVSLNFNLGDIKSDLSLLVKGNVYSDLVNTVFNERIPNYIEDNRTDIRRAIGYFISVVLNIHECSDWRNISSVN